MAGPQGIDAQTGLPAEQRQGTQDPDTVRFHNPEGTGAPPTKEQLKNTVEFEDHIYGTLEFTPPDSKLNECGLDDFRPLPEGWELAPDVVETQFLIGAHTWGTTACVVNGGACYTTQHWNGSRGSKISNFEYIEEDGTFKLRRRLPSRPTRLFIRAPKS
eukprot:gnl/TRDRNA2_/TRDRNA2_190402_c0_seq1.p1 gnl/TRDRNA2_/TRDRNA2_190402_c0~~gnl/TRDRNA2_/TRDRNA2_190402_c0_seq1.p1  ORF type:complete len:159 (-),score=26.59 gnl/TRDRNA2_/TRDRNA2_190402_c0_seq1:84-560(-)